MKKILLLATLLLAINLTGQKALFNGENLDGWTIYGSEKWYVEDGLLVCESGPDKQYGYLATDEFYKNFTCMITSAT